MKKIASYSLISILGLLIFFHLLILIGVIPYDIVWGGRLDSKVAMVKFETISLLVNLVFLLIVLVRAEIIKIAIPPIITTILLWGMVGLFVLNTFGNLLSTNRWEKIIFTPMTILLTIFCVILALDK